METQEFFKNWKSDSPKSFEEFEKYLKKYNLMFETNYNDDIRIIMNFFFIKKPLTDISEWQCLIFEFEMLTGVIEKFFEDNHIIITIKFQDNQFYNYIDFINDNIEIEKLYHSGKWYMNKKDCQIMSYLKAAEILEKEIK